MKKTITAALAASLSLWASASFAQPVPVTCSEIDGKSLLSRDGNFRASLEAVSTTISGSFVWFINLEAGDNLSVIPDNGIQFCEQPRNRNTAYSPPMRFDMICAANDIEHRLTKPNHPWTNGQVERMNRTIKDATVKRYHYDSHEQLRTHLGDFLDAYNYARRLKTLSGLTPYEYICKIWTSEPDRFILNPIHQMPGLNT